MSIDFGERAERLKEAGINQAMSSGPDFENARSYLLEALSEVSLSGDPLKTGIYGARIENDLGVVDVREGLFGRSSAGFTDEEALVHVSYGLRKIVFSYTSLMAMLREHGTELRARTLVPTVHGHVCATMNTWFRALQTKQLLSGDIGPDKKASDETIDEQWMLGRGRADKSGAWVHGRQGDNGYWSTQTPLLAARGERINGGPAHAAKGLAWLVARGIPEASRRLVTDPANRRQIVLTAGRLSLESVTRKGAISAALDYRRF